MVTNMRLQVITSEEQYDDSLAEIDRLILRDPRAGSEEADRLSVLAVLSYRGISFWLPTVPGAIAYFQLRRTVARWREEQGSQGAGELHPGSVGAAGAVGVR